jgi:hypothetical protein
MRKKTSTNKLPKEVNVLGTKYKIFYSSEKCNPKMARADGYVERFLKEIHINSDLYDEEYKKDPAIAGGLERHIPSVFRHEIIHAFLFECGLWENCDWATNEEMTDWFAKQFPKIQKVFKQLGVEK